MSLCFDPFPGVFGVLLVIYIGNFSQKSYLFDHTFYIFFAGFIYFTITREALR